MPTYSIKNTKTGKIRLYDLTISEMEKFQKQNPTFDVLCGKPGIGYTMNLKKPDGWFRDRLKEIKRRNPGSTINTI